MGRAESSKELLDAVKAGRLEPVVFEDGGRRMLAFSAPKPDLHNPYWLQDGGLWLVDKETVYRRGAKPAQSTLAEAAKLLIEEAARSAGADPAGSKATKAGSEAVSFGLPTTGSEKLRAGVKAFFQNGSDSAKRLAERSADLGKRIRGEELFEMAEDCSQTVHLFADGSALATYSRIASGSGGPATTGWTVETAPSLKALAGSLSERVYGTAWSDAEKAKKASFEKTVENLASPPKLSSFKDLVLSKIGFGQAKPQAPKGLRA